MQGQTFPDLKQMMLLCNVSDEDFESAVKALNGKLYPDTPENKSASSGDGM